MARLEQISSPVERARCAAISSLAAFVEAVDPAVDREPEAFWTCAEAFRTLLGSNFLADVMAWELDCLRRDPDYVPCPRGERDFEVLHLGRLALSVRVQVPDAGEPSPLLYGFSEHHITANMGPGVVGIERWTQPWVGPPEVFDRTKGLVEAPSLLVRPGEQVSFQAHRDVARTRAMSTAAVLVGLTRVQVTRLRWVYDRGTLFPVRAEAADLDASRLDYAMALLSALDHREAAPVIATLYEHPDHFVRWSAVRRVIELDPARGTPLVYRALTDPHPHIRRAAQRSLERYEASRSEDITDERKTHGPDA